MAKALKCKVNLLDFQSLHLVIRDSEHQMLVLMRMSKKKGLVSSSAVYLDRCTSTTPLSLHSEVVVTLQNKRQCRVAAEHTEFARRLSII